MMHREYQHRQFMSRDSNARHPEIGKPNPGFTYAKRESPRAKATPGVSFKAKGRTPPPGEGGRFKALSEAIAKRRGVRNPGAVAAAIGRRKYGAKKFAKMAAAGRRAS